jgi:hypothetical protein
MDNQVQQAVHHMLKAYGENIGSDLAGLESDVMNCYTLAASFMLKLEALDRVVDEHPKLDALREYLVDLLFIHFFSEDAQALEEDYLESEEWEQIEDETLDRGTELLNVLLYLKECKEEGEEPELGDFLKEFLLVDDDEFQDEYNIYESVIANQILIEAEQSEIAKASSALEEDDEMKELFYPVISYFSSLYFDSKHFETYLQHSSNKAHDAALLAALYAFTDDKLL